MSYILDTLSIETEIGFRKEFLDWSCLDIQGLDIFLLVYYINTS